MCHDEAMNTPVRPEDVLPNDADTASFGGTLARKGTVAAFVANAKLLEDLPQEAGEREAVLAELRDLLPGLRAVGVLDGFSPRSAAIAALVEETAREDRLENVPQPSRTTPRESSSF